MGDDVDVNHGQGSLRATPSSVRAGNLGEGTDVEHADHHDNTSHKKCGSTPKAIHNEESEDDAAHHFHNPVDAGRKQSDFSGGVPKSTKY
jgi:hypothetical protein